MIPKSAKANRETWQLWKMCENLSPDEIRVLIKKRKNDLKYEKNPEGIKKLRTDISILNEACVIMTKRRK